MTTAPAALTADEVASQSLAAGPAGIALLSIENALTGSGDWQSAHLHIAQAAAGPIDVGAHTGLYYGAPAIDLVLHAAGADGQPRYGSAVKELDRHVLRLTYRRLANAADRMQCGDTATFGEYDLFHGLVGIGALLLYGMPNSDALAEVLHYLVRLVEPRRDDGVLLPGWWVAHDPDPMLPTLGGHANFGMAHGAAGLLALLALATSRGCVVDGQADAIEHLGMWFDTWRQDSADGPWWPQWVTREELRTGRLAQNLPGRPSWCYGAVGIARAQQLAAIATGDPVQRKAAEDALAACLTDRQLNRVTDPGLCHGAAGVYQTAFRAARDAESPKIRQRLPLAATTLARRAAASRNDGSGLLTGDAGVRLAMETTRRTVPPRSGWDACLLIA